MKTILRLLASSMLVVWLISAAAVFAAETPESQPRCRLNYTVYDREGKTVDQTNATHVQKSVWMKFETPESERCPQIPANGIWFENEKAWYVPSPYHSELEPGTYRISFIKARNFSKWEGPPGSWGGGSSSNTHTGRHSVHGFGHPEHVLDWALGEPFTVTGEEEKLDVELHAKPGRPAVFRIDMEFYGHEIPWTVYPWLEPPPELTEETRQLCRERDEALRITMQVFSEAGFPIGFRSDSMYGLPYEIKFDALPPGRYTVRLTRNITSTTPMPPPAGAVTAATDEFHFDVTEDGENLFLVKPEKTLSTAATWQIFGTVRDEDGNPVPGIHVGLSYGFTMFPSLYPLVETDEEGRYRLGLTPFRSDSGVLRNEDGDGWRWGFRLQQGVLSAPANDYNKDRLYAEASRSKEGDIILLGEFADETVRAQVEARPEKIVVVPRNEPVEIDFVLKNVPPEKFDDPREEYLSYFTKTFWDGLAPETTVKLYRELVLPQSMNRFQQERWRLADGITTTLELPKKEIVFGEAIVMNYVVHNGSDTTIGVEDGGDYRGVNRPSSFSVRAIREDGSVLPEILRGGNMGGMVGIHAIPPGETYTFDLCLPCWLDIPEPGVYEIQAARYLNVQMGDVDTFRSRDFRLPREASAKLTVLPYDEEKLGQAIKELQTVAEMEYHGNEEYNRRNNARKLLEHLNDPRARAVLEEIKNRENPPKEK